MNKKFLSAILFGALMVTSTGTFVSCKDYDDDIENLQTQIYANSAAISELKNLVQNNDYVTGVEVSGSNLVVSFKNAGTKTLALPKDEKGSLCKVVDGVLYIDGTATDIKVCETPVVEEGEFLPAVKIENGEWAVLQEDKTYASTGIAASSIAIAENTKGGYTLTVKDAEGVETEVELPATKVITNLEAGSVAADGKFENAITVYYGAKVKDINNNKDLTFNGKTYGKNTYLLSQDATLSAIVNPLDADATKYEFKLVNSKGDAPFVISDIKQNVTAEDKPISRANTANQGVWDMTLTYADATEVAVSGSYALTTETVNGTVASPYDLALTATKVTSVTTTALAEVSGNCNTDIDLRKSFNEKDWAKYIVDYYFEIPDKTAAASAGVSLNGNMIKRTINSTLTYTNVKVYFLLVDGTVTSGENITVNFKQVAPTQTLADIEWTINDTNKTVYLSLNSIQAQLAGTQDSDIPTIANIGSTWADGTAFTEASVVVNGYNYGKANSDYDAAHNIAFDPTWITSLSTQLLSKNADGTAYENASTIQKEMFAKFTFDETTAFPGEYIVKLGFKKVGEVAGNYTLVVPVKVTIKAPAQTIVKYENYFTGDNAVAYGTADGSYAKYQLTELFKTTGLTFTETVVKDANNVAYTAWITTAPEIKVPVYSYAQNADNTVSVGSAHEFTASIIPFGNVHIQKTEYKFNLTIKSAISEGEFSSTASKTIETSVPVKFFANEFNGVDVYGDKFYIAETYEYDKNGNLSKVNRKDNRITSITIEPADDNAKDYLTIGSAFGNEAGEKPAAEYFTVERKSGLTQLVEDTTCKINVTILDKWGIKTTTTVTVVLKKF